MKILARLLAVLAVWSALFAAPAVAQVPGTPAHVAAVLSAPAPFAPTAALALDFTSRARFRQVRTRTNAFTNPTMVGAVAGTPGTVPTGWSVSVPAGGNRQVVGTGVENGLAYIDLRIWGTNSSGATQFPTITPDSAIAGANGQTWSTAFTVSMVGGSTAGLSGGGVVIVNMAEYNTASGFLTGSTTNVTPTATPQRVLCTRTFNNASTEFARGYVNFQIANGNSYDITLRLAGPQLEKAPAASSFIVGSVTENVVGAIQPLGPELVTNGTFDTDLSGWIDASTAPSTTTWSGGQALFNVNSAATARLRQQVSTVPGRTYQVTATSANVSLQVGTTAGASDLLASGGANGTRVFVATTTAAHLWFNTGINGGTIDNVSVREIFGGDLYGWSFSRTGTGLADSTAGTYASFGSNVPRITDKGLLVEEARTNLAIRSQEFDNATWVKSASSVLADQAVAPDGTVTADKIVENSATIEHYTQVSSTTAAGTFTGSVFFKAASGGRNAQLRLQTASGGIRVNIDTSTGAILTQPGAVFGTVWSSISGGVVNYGNGWFRAYITGATSETNVILLAFPLNGTASNYSGDGASGIYVWGAQLEQAAFPTSYIPTTGASATRPADTPALNVSGLDQSFTMVETVIMPPGVSSDARISLSANGSITERVYLSWSGPGNGIAVAGNTAAGALGAPPVSAAVASGQRVKIALSWDAAATRWRLGVNGVSGQGSSSGLLPAGLNRLEFASAGGVIRQWGAFIESVVFYPRASDLTECARLTQ